MPAASLLTSPRAFLVAGLAALLAYAVFVGAHTSPVAAGSDSAGYLLSAKLLTEGQLSTPLRTVPELSPIEPWENTPLGMIHSERLGELIPTYPIGLPLFYALASTLAGWTWGPILVAVIMACGAVVFTFLCAREFGASRPFAGLAAAAVAVCPLVFHTTLQPLSDTASAAWNAAAVFCALRARRTPAWGWGLAAGAALAVSVLLRPSNLLLLPVLALLLGQPRLLLQAALGGLPGAVFLGWYQHALYGSVLMTGYGSVWSMFGAVHVAPALYKYHIWIPAFLPLSVIALALVPWMPWHTRGRELTALLLWVVGYAGFYAFYPPTHEHRWFLRFVLPMFPALAILAVLGLQSVLERLRQPQQEIARPAVLALALGITLGAGWHHWRASRFADLAPEATAFRDIPIWVESNLPRDSIILTLYPSCSFYFYSDLAIVRSDVIKPERFAELATAAQASGHPVFAIVKRDDDEAALLRRLPGAWVDERMFGDFHLWRLRQSQ